MGKTRKTGKRGMREVRRGNEGRGPEMTRRTVEQGKRKRGSREDSVKRRDQGRKNRRVDQDPLVILLSGCIP